MALAYEKAGRYEEATDQLHWVVQSGGSEEYRHWAQAQLTYFQQSRKTIQHLIEKKPYLLGKISSAYDSNPLLIPDDENLSSRSKKDGVFYGVDLEVGYPFVLEKDARVDAVYAGHELFHDGGTQEADFTTQGLALDAKKRLFFGERAVIFGGRYDFRANFSRSDLFSTVHQGKLSLDTSFWKRTRTHLYTRLSYSNFGPDGTAPGLTSRDGVRGGVGAAQYFYSADYKAYFFVKEELSLADTRGKNFNRKGSLTYLGVHTPIRFLSRTDFDAAIGFDWGTYPDFASLSLLDPVERRDARTDVYSALTYYLKPNVALRGFYRFINSDDPNDFFDHQRHIAGGEVIFSI